MTDFDLGIPYAPWNETDLALKLDDGTTIVVPAWTAVICPRCDAVIRCKGTKTPEYAKHWEDKHS